MRFRRIRTPGLQNLFGAYLNQDMDDFYADEWDAVDGFVAREPLLRARVPSEIDDLLSRLHTPEEFERHFYQIGAEMGPSPEDDGCPGWLGKISERVRARLRELEGNGDA